MFVILVIVFRDAKLSFVRNPRLPTSNAMKDTSKFRDDISRTNGAYLLHLYSCALEMLRSKGTVSSKITNFLSFGQYSTMFGLSVMGITFGGIVEGAPGWLF